jgi:hypothetical protein
MIVVAVLPIGAGVHVGCDARRVADGSVEHRLTDEFAQFLRVVTFGSRDARRGVRIEEATASGADPERVAERGIELHEFVRVKRADLLRQPASRHRLEVVAVRHRSNPQSVIRS